MLAEAVEELSQMCTVALRNAELANGRLAMMAIIGMFFQDGLTGSAWGDWANYTESPLRAFENELGDAAALQTLWLRCVEWVLLSCYCSQPCFRQGLNDKEYQEFPLLFVPLPDTCSSTCISFGSQSCMCHCHSTT